MAASKPLILLKGIGGFAATSLATLGGMEIGYKFLSSKTIERTESEEGSWGIEFEPEEYTEEIRDLRIPSGCVETCDLTAEQLRSLKFEQRSDSSILFDGLTESDTFELAISEVNEDRENYPRGKKYILKAKATAGTVTIKNVKGDDIVLGEEGVDLRETREGGRLEKVPEEVNELGIPKRCETDSAEDSTSQTCELTKEQLQRLKLEPKNSGGSISIKGLKDNERVELTIEDSSDSTNYPKNKKYTLTSKTGTVTIKGVKDGDVVLEANQGVDFREKQGDSKLLETVEDSLGIPRRCVETCQLTKEEIQKLKFETGDESSISIEDQTEPVALTIEDKSNDLTNYPKGKKYTLNLTSGEVVIRETSLGGRLEKAPEEVNELGIPKSCNRECQLTKEQLQRFKFEPKGNDAITVEGLTGNNTVTLKIEDKNGDINYPKGKKYTLKTTTGTVTIRNVKEGDIEIKTGGDAVIRETGRGGKLEKVPEEVDGLGIPNSCNSRSSCKLTKDQLQKLKFETRSSSSISITGLRENDTVDLTVTSVSNDSTNYPKGKKYTLTSTNSKVTIKGLKDGDIVLETKQRVVIREKQSGGLMEKASEEVNALGIPWARCISRTPCQLTKEQLQRFKFETNGDNSPIWVTGLGNSDRVTLKVEDSDDKTNYPQIRKYSFKVEKEGVAIKNTKDGEIVLEKDKWVDFREKSGSQLETVVDSLGIPRSCNAEKVKRGSVPQTCGLTAEQLKNIKFKTFGGKSANANVIGLYGTEKLKLTISWIENSKYPDNKKYSFDNEAWRDGEIKITRSGQTVKIEKKKESLFKNEGGQLELVGAKQKAEITMEETNEILEKLGLERLKLINYDFTSLHLKQHKQKKIEISRKDDLKKIKFKELDGGAETVGDLRGQKITVFLDWDDNTEKYPNNMKITFQNESISSYVELKKSGKNSVKIWKKGDDNPNNKMNVFKVEGDQLVNVPQDT